ncbi:MAG TPA: preprotein translocase subunit YajC [Novosphingobium sp.]|nr:preprotein translocase subunit YajC [Novosphingobium sp.]
MQKVSRLAAIAPVATIALVLAGPALAQQAALQQAAPARMAYLPTEPVQPAYAPAQGAPLGEADGAEDLGGAEGQDGPSTSDAAHPKQGRSARRFTIRPYIEAMQVFDADVAGDHEVDTYTTLAAGADGQLNGRNTKAAFSVRYEHRIGEHNAGDGDGVSGMLRGRSRLGTDGLHLDYGAMAQRMHLDAGGAATADTGIAAADTQLYSAFIGPSFAGKLGALRFEDHYHYGYTAVSGGTAGVGGAGGTDVLSHAQVHDLGGSLGNRPGEGLPVGLSVEGGYHEEDVSNLGQRFTDAYGQGRLTVPVAPHLALTGALGYEHVEVSAHDALYDASGNVLYDSAGRLETDWSSPRHIAFDTSGLTWDAGLIWRPSRRTSLEAHVGRRYGALGGYGSFSYQPDPRNSFNLVVYNEVGSSGGAMVSGLVGTSTDFSAIRDAISGALVGCAASVQGTACIAGASGSLSSAIGRRRGVLANWGINFGRVQAGIGAGYDRREYLTGSGTVLGSLNGEVDQYEWVAAYIADRLSARASVQGTVDLYHYETGLAGSGNVSAIRVSGVYQYMLTRHLTASAALAINGMSREALDDLWATSGALAMRYNF